MDNSLFYVCYSQDKVRRAKNLKKFRSIIFSEFATVNTKKCYVDEKYWYEVRRIS